MRQFILGKNLAYATEEFDAIAEGKVGIYYIDPTTGKPKVSADGTDVPKTALLVLGRPAAKGGNVVLPICKNDFSFVKGEYQAATAFTSDFTITSVSPNMNYTVIVTKKGVGFNERSNWTASVYSKATDTPTTIAKALETQINLNSVGSGVKATAAEGKLTIAGIEKGVDYNITLADALIGLTLNKTAAVHAYGDAKYIVDLAEKAAADAGFEYTYDNGLYELYPGYDFNPLAAADSADTGFTIFTLKFTEDREVATTTNRDVKQIVQVAFPTGTGAITTFETVCKAIAGIA